jgi:uncharacterized protein (TIGR03086 family)
MMDLLESIDAAAAEFGRLVDGTEPNQLANPTPCAAFTVRDLLGHVASGATMFAIAFEQGSVPDEELGRVMSPDFLGDDYKAAYAQAIARATAAFSAPGGLDGTVALPFGEMPREAAVGIAVFDVLVHCSDLARATGQDLALTDADAEAALALGQTLGIDNMRDGVAFAEAVVVADDASGWDRLVAFSGRTP